MGYTGGKLASFCTSVPSKITGRRMCVHGSQSILHLVVQNTPINDSPFPSRPPGTARRSWRTKPVVPGATMLSAIAWEGGVETDDQIALYLETGTGLYGPHHRAYEITPKAPGGSLHFYWRRFGRWVTLRKVMHPGIHAQRPLATGMAMAEHELDRLLASDLDEWRRMWEALVLASAVRL